MYRHCTVTVVFTPLAMSLLSLQEKKELRAEKEELLAEMEQARRDSNVQLRDSHVQLEAAALDLRLMREEMLQLRLGGAHDVEQVR